MWKEKSTHPHTDHSQNGRIEGFHNFLKSCLAKHISRNREWDDVAPLATCIIQLAAQPAFKGITFLCYVW